VTAIDLLKQGLTSVVFGSANLGLSVFLVFLRQSRYCYCAS